MGAFHLFEIVQMLPNRTTYYIYVQCFDSKCEKKDSYFQSCLKFSTLKQTKFTRMLLQKCIWLIIYQRKLGQQDITKIWMLLFFALTLNLLQSNKQGSTHKDTFYNWLVHVFLHSFISFSFIFTSSHSCFIFPKEYKLLTWKFTSYIYYYEIN